MISCNQGQPIEVPPNDPVALVDTLIRRNRDQVRQYQRRQPGNRFQ